MLSQVLWLRDRGERILWVLGVKKMWRREVAGQFLRHTESSGPDKEVDEYLT